MKNILVLGAGKIARPLLRYLLNRRDYRLVVGTLDVERAQQLLDDHPHGRAIHVDVEDGAKVEALVHESDIVVSLLPAHHNPRLARLAIEQGKNLINTSYVAPEMLALDAEARAKGVLLLCEIGLDPGIDHMSAVRVIHQLSAAGGKLNAFTSCCGGFPAPDANTNPWGYKFSWSQRGVLLAGRNPARYLRKGETIDIPGPELFGHHWPYEVEGQGVFEMYPNRDSLKYIEPYRLGGIQGMFRGTLRYPGWCETMRAAARLGLYDIEERDWPEGTTYADFVARLLPRAAGGLVARLSEYLELDRDSFVIARLEWAGLLSDRPIGERRASPLDVFCRRLTKLMVYEQGERDMVALRHGFAASFPDGHSVRVISSLVETGEPFGDTAMARTVSLPAAVATDLALRGELHAVGVQIPVHREIYDPVLDELAEHGIRFRETYSTTYPGPLS
jgi:saccharopine dehydrogenase-like NADP-dependent oxidoreductase